MPDRKSSPGYSQSAEHSTGRSHAGHRGLQCSRFAGRFSRFHPGDLEPYPRLSYEQGQHNSFYFSEEILSTRSSQKDIQVCDRATLFNLLIGLKGYTICSGVINETLNGKDIVAVPLAVEDYMEIGYITHKKIVPGHFGQKYIQLLQDHVRDWTEAASAL